MPSLSELLEVAVEAAYLGGRRTLAHFGTGVAVEAKADLSPVTVADRESEAAIRERIRRSFAAHPVLGEEEGLGGGDAEGYRWIVDPLDGTKTFVRGVPLYGVLVGVEVDGEARAGAVYLPALDEMLAAASGLGCRLNGRPVRSSSVSRLEEATVLVTDEASTRARSEAYAALSGRARFVRSWGDCYGYVLVATGRAEVMLDPAMNPWDCGPLLPILEEAAGRFTTWAGERTIHGPDAVGTNGLLHNEVLELLRGG